MSEAPVPQPETTRSQITRVEPVPFTPQEVQAVFGQPQRILELVLGERERLAATVAERRTIGKLVAALVFTSLVFAIPYGLVLDWRAFWRVEALFLGSLAICFPSLHVVSAYLGCRIGLAQNLALALVISCVAAVFSFGFFPIQWFLQQTMLDDASTIGPRHLSLLFLGISLVAGIGHLGRCLYRERLLKPLRSAPLVLFLWNALLVFITYRMAVTLDLLP
jgi:hypothetical protein